MKIQAFDSSYFHGKSNFEDDGTTVNGKIEESNGKKIFDTISC